MTVFDYPKNTCGNCKQDKWWWTSGNWVCFTCHPPADEIQKLRARAIIGNAKLYEAWRQIYQVTGGDEESEAAYKAAAEKLRALGKELKARSKDCLYIDRGKKLIKCLGNPGEWFCHACPNEYWAEKELMDMDRAKHPTYVRTNKPVYITKPGEQPVLSGPEIEVYDD